MPETGCPGRFRALLLLLTAALLLGGCGFHLRGQLALPKGAEHILISGIAPSQPLGQEIARLYTRAGGVVVDKREEADAVLEILGQKDDRRVAAVNSEGRVSQYELYYELNFRLLDLRGEIIHPATAVSVTRDYAFDPNNVLGKAQEETLLREDMRQQAISQMLRLLSRGTGNPPASEQPADATTPTIAPTSAETPAGETPSTAPPASEAPADASAP